MNAARARHVARGVAGRLRRGAGASHGTVKANRKAYASGRASGSLDPRATRQGLSPRAERSRAPLRLPLLGHAAAGVASRGNDRPSAIRLPEDFRTSTPSGRRQIVQLGSSGLPTLDALGASEREALFTSLAVMVKTADYHVKRFHRLLVAINGRRAKGNALITYDFSVEYAVFEAAAALSAMRSAVDEIIFIAARASGVSAPELKEKKWQTNNVMLAGYEKAPEFNMPAVMVLRDHLDW